ncbi:MAG: hypothetical protein HY735_17460 [Verrucomicrobia bacterium]|nr:hypothetical protein [Verrucomicrobiota bacterium]
MNGEQTYLVTEHMKRNHLKLAALLAALLSFGIAPANALPEAKTKAIQQLMAEVPVLELVPKAADIVQKANDADRLEVAATVTRAILSTKPTLAASLVEAIAEVAPETSTVIATLAAELCPAQAQEIARIAASYAPEQASEIAVGVSKAAPNAALSVTRRVVGVVPEMSDKVTEAVMAGVPSSKPAIEGDATLAIVSSIARNTRSSASLPVRKFIRPIPILDFRLPPIPTRTVSLFTRPLALTRLTIDIEASSTRNRLPTRETAKLLSDSARLGNSIINATSGLTRQEQDDALNNIKNNVDKILSTPTGGAITTTTLSSLAATLLQASKTAYSDTSSTAAEKKAIDTFIQTQTVALTTNPTSAANPSALKAAIDSLVEEVKKVSEIAKTTDDPAKIQQQLDQSARQIGDTVKAYAAPGQ